MDKLGLLKTCSCGEKFHALPDEAKLVSGLYWFNCICGSTCVVTARQVRNAYLIKHVVAPGIKHKLPAKPKPKLEIV